MIGEGLFSNSDYKVGDHIADYKGELIFNLEADRRVDANKLGYMIHVFNSITGQKAINNASIVVSTSVAGKTTSMQEDFKAYRNHYNLWTCNHLP